MAEVTFYGASDDLVEFEGAISEEFNTYSRWQGRLVSPSGESLILSAEFSKPGSDSDWTLTVENSADSPSWPIRFGERPDRDDDPAIIIDVPEGTIVKEDSDG